MSTLPSPDDLLTGGAPALKFDALGVTHRGVVVRKATAQQTDITTGAPLFWPDGNPKTQLVVTIRTEERDPNVPGDDGERRLFLRGSASLPQSGLGAVIAALKAAGGGTLDPGDELAVRYVSDGEAKPGLTAPKQYVAQVRKNAAPAPADDLLNAPIDPVAGGPFENTADLL